MVCDAELESFFHIGGDVVPIMDVNENLGTPVKISGIEASAGEHNVEIDATLMRLCGDFSPEVRQPAYVSVITFVYPIDEDEDGLLL